MKDIKLNEIILALAGFCLFIGGSNLLAISEGVNAPQDPFEWLKAALWLGIAGLVLRGLGKIARAR